MHSMNVVECVSNWKFGLSQYGPESVQPAFVYKEDNYLLKMNSDCSWLKRSQISRFIDFGEKTDTFLSSITGISELVLSNAFLGKIIMCKKVISEELYSEELYVSPGKSMTLPEFPSPPKEIVPLAKKGRLQQAMTIDDKYDALLKHSVSDALIDQYFISIIPILIDDTIADFISEAFFDVTFKELPIMVNEIATDHYTEIVGN